MGFLAEPAIEDRRVPALGGPITNARSWDADFIAVDDRGQFSKSQVFFVRLNNGTRAIRDDRERERYIAQRWGSPTSG